MKNFLLLLVSFFLLTQIYSQTNYWEGNTTNWHNAANWSLNHVPNSSEDATIPTVGVTYFPNVYSGNAECKNFTIVSGANVELFNGISFHVYGDANISGSIIIDDELTYIYLHDDIFWWSGSQCINNSPSSYGSTIYIYDDWNFESGSNVVLDKVNVTFVPAGSSSSIIECNSATSSFYTLSMLKSAASSVLLSGSSTEAMQVTYKLTIGANNNFYSYSNHDLVVNRHFDNSGHFYFSNGNLLLNNFVFDIQFNEGDFANNLSITPNVGYVDILGNVTVNGNIEINGSGVDIENTLFLGGDFDNNTYLTDVDTININGNDIQNIYNLECNTLILNKPSGEMRFPTEVSYCAYYDWEQGFYRVNGGIFTINDLVDNGIYGTISITSGVLNIHQGTSGGEYIDLNATLFMSGGECNVYGGSYESWWSYGDDVSITMSGGTLDFVDNSIRIHSVASHSFSENISGGTIRTSDFFTVARDNFNPTGGLIQLYGTDDAGISHVEGSNFFNLEIDKSSKNYIPNPIIRKSRDGKIIKSAKSNTITAYSDLNINGDFTLSAGSFTAPPIMNVAGDWTNDWGDNEFLEGTGLVIFDGSTDQIANIKWDGFYTLEIDKSGGMLIIPDESHFECQNYDWTQGGYHVDGGVFNIRDLVDDGIYGSIVLSLGNLNITQGTSSGEYVDLNGSLTITGGSMGVSGGIDDSYWSYNGDASITMSGGNIWFWDVGVRIYDNPSFTFIENISGGTIFSSTNFIVERNNFTPEGGEVCMTGETDGVISHVPGSYLNDFRIANYTSKSKESNYKKFPRIEVLNNKTDGNTITAFSDLDINGDLLIRVGTSTSTFIAPAVMHVAGDWANEIGEIAFVEGTGEVIFDGTIEADIINTEIFYDMSVNKTSVAEDALENTEAEAITVLHNLEIQDGKFYMNNNTTLNIDNDLTIADGSRLKANNGIINIGGNWDDNNTSDVGFFADYSTVTFNGPDHQYLFCDYLYAEFNNLIIDKPGGTGMDSFEPQTNVRLFGNLQVLDGNWYDTPTDNNHMLFGDLYIGADGRWTDASGIITLAESTTQSFINDGGGYFDVIVFNKNNPTNQVNLGGNLVFDNLNINTGAVTMADSYYLNHEGIFVEANASLTLDAGTWLVSDDGADINVAAGGRMTVNGTETDHCVITQNGGSGYYDFNVDGELGAGHTEFRFMSADGIQINPGATLTPGHAFNNCIFSNGEAGGTYLTINNNQTITSDGASFNLNNWGGNSNVRKTLDQGNITFVNFSGDFSGEAFDDDAYNRINWDDGIKQINIAVSLEGPFYVFGGYMETSLNNQGLIPNNQPYNVSPWNYSGSESVPVMPNTDIVDWVLVEYRDAPNASSATSATAIGRQAAFLLSHASIVDVDGSSFLDLPYTINHQLFVVIYHRNHLGIMSAGALTESGGIFTYNFSSTPDKAYGTNAMKNLGGIYGMFAGDANADGEITINDHDLWKTNAGSTGYFPTDFDLNVQVNNLDKNDKWFPNRSFESQVPE